jgi:YD repeat-containing protein
MLTQEEVGCLSDEFETRTPTPTQPFPSGSVTITYTYDVLGRLTAADYSEGQSCHYTYEAVGNRLTQETQYSTINYTYDIANRLTSVDGVRLHPSINSGQATRNGGRDFGDDVPEKHRGGVPEGHRDGVAMTQWKKSRLNYTLNCDTGVVVSPI